MTDNTQYKFKFPWALLWLLIIFVIVFFGAEFKLPGPENETNRLLWMIFILLCIHMGWTWNDAHTSRENDDAPMKR